MGPCGRALSQIANHASSATSPLQPPGPTIKGYASGPATRILDLELDMEVELRYFLSVFLTAVKSSNLVRSFRLLWRFDARHHKRDSSAQPV